MIMQKPIIALRKTLLFLSVWNSCRTSKKHFFLSKTPTLASGLKMKVKQCSTSLLLSVSGRAPKELSSKGVRLQGNHPKPNHLFPFSAAPFGTTCFLLPPRLTPTSRSAPVPSRLLFPMKEQKASLSPGNRTDSLPSLRYH